MVIIINHPYPFWLKLGGRAGATRVGGRVGATRGLPATMPYVYIWGIGLRLFVSAHGFWWVSPPPRFPPGDAGYVPASEEEGLGYVPGSSSEMTSTTSSSSIDSEPDPGSQPWPVGRATGLPRAHNEE